MSVDDLLGAMRAADGDDPELAAVTQLRLRRSLETRARGRHQLVGLMTAAAILLGGTVSWALATGQIATLWSPAPVLAPAAPQGTTTKRRPPRHPAMATLPAPPPSPETVPPAPPAPTPAPPAPTPPPAPRPTTPRAIPRPTAAPVEALYRRAHELHFHGGDPAVTLAAWDAYLAAEPDGRFSVDARYNRALLLVRLGRYAEARAALLPFAHGEVTPAGYHQPEAAQLVERLGRFE